jgi:hypothetical protein
MLKEFSLLREAGAGKLIYPEYYVYLKNGDRFLLAGKKRPNNKVRGLPSLYDSLQQMTRFPLTDIKLYRHDERE